jgi:hypothetical protein
VSLIERKWPLVAVVFRVPLFVEALDAAFDGLADVQGVRRIDAGLEGLLKALRPDAVVVEGPDNLALELFVPVVHVDLERQTVESWVDGAWRGEQVDLSGEAIRNVVLTAMLAGAGA